MATSGFFLFGLFIGSFLNMLIDRLPREEQIWKGRSHCDSCKHPLEAFDLIPVVSWILLSGRCRYCRSPIPARNVVVELSTGILFLLNHLTIKQSSPQLLEFSTVEILRDSAIYQQLGVYIVMLMELVILSSLIVIFFIDLYHQLIPDDVIHVGIIASLLKNILLYGINVRLHGLHLLAGFVAYAFFYVLYIGTKKKGMGYGDVKLALFMGVFLGFPGIVYGLYVAFLTGAIVSVMLILRRRKKFGQTIAFGPFLVLGTIAAYFNLIQPWWVFIH